MNDKVKTTPITRLEMEEIFRTVFKNPQGKRVLKYLNDQYYDCKFKSEDIERQVGRRDVMQDINNHLRER